MSTKININRYFLKGLPNECSIVEVNGNTVSKCIQELTEKLPDIKNELFDSKGELLEWVCIFLNEKDTFPDELDMPVKDGDEIDLIPLIGGG